MLFMVDAQLMQHGCPEVVDITWFFSDVIPKFIGGTVCRPALETSTSQPDTESERIVVATSGALGYEAELQPKKAPEPKGK